MSEVAVTDARQFLCRQLHRFHLTQQHDRYVRMTFQAGNTRFPIIEADLVRRDDFFQQRFVMVDADHLQWQSRTHRCADFAESGWMHTCRDLTLRSRGCAHIALAIRRLKYRQVGIRRMIQCHIVEMEVQRLNVVFYFQRVIETCLLYTSDAADE